MIRELATLGGLSSVVSLDALPPLVELDAQASYLSWNMELAGPDSEAPIREVFDWAEGDCDLTITRVTPPADVLDAPAADALLSAGEVEIEPVAAEVEIIAPETPAVAAEEAPQAASVVAPTQTAPAPAAAKEA